MNVYDQAHQLARAIKESEECKRFNKVKKKVEDNPELDAAIKDFMKRQFEFQAAQMMGEEPRSGCIYAASAAQCGSDAGSSYK